MALFPIPNHLRNRLTTLTISLVALACSREKTWDAEMLKAYEAEVHAWHAERIRHVMAPDGWLNLVGLYWLEPGANTFGADEKNDIVFPRGKIAAQAGYFLVQGSKVSIKVNEGVPITIDDKPISSQVIFYSDSMAAATIESGSLKWTIIRRGANLGVRLRDNENELLKTFKGIDRFPIDPGYRAEATFEPAADSSHTIAVTNVLGQTTQQSSPGAFVFNLQGNEYRLDVLQGNEHEYFIVFGDATSGRETYGGGRFLYVTKPVPNEKSYVDFNKAYNPPCVFTPYATCPLPPKQNELPIEVKAGEKNYRRG